MTERSPAVALTPGNDGEEVTIEIIYPDARLGIVFDPDPDSESSWFIVLRKDGKSDDGRLDDVEGLRHWMRRFLDAEV